jgi:L-ribulokinase
MFAATAAGLHSNVESAMRGMGQGFEKTYYADSSHFTLNQKRYLQYKKMGAAIEFNLMQNP